MTELVLSLFPGVGLLDMAFQEAGFCVVRGPDLIHGGDIRGFAGVPGRFDGIVAGPPCQGFSTANRRRGNPDHPSVRNSREMLARTMCIIDDCQPEWFLIENVPSVPTVRAPGYKVQRIAISDWECGGVQQRSRAIQFGSRSGDIIRPERVNDRSKNQRKGRRPLSITTKPVSRHQTYADQCRRQGLVHELQLPGWTKSAKFRAIGNGVPLSIGRAVAAAVQVRTVPGSRDCPCECGRLCSGRRKTATDSCRKRWELMRKRAFSSAPFVDRDGYHDRVPAAASGDAG